MEQSDLELLQLVPSYHLQAVAKARRIPVTIKLIGGDSFIATPTNASSFTEIARYLFDPSAISTVLLNLSELETLILCEVLACGGRVNSRDLALYFASTDLLSKNESSSPKPPARAYSISLQYPIAHPHGVFEQAIRQLLIMGLLFWGKQTNFSGRDYTSGIHDGVLIMPFAVQETAQRTWNVEVPTQVPETIDVGDAARAFQRTLYLYWSLVASMREGLALVSNGQLSRSSLRHVVEHMEGKNHQEQVRLESDLPRLFFVRLLLMKLGLLQERQGALHAVHAAVAEAFFALPLVERLHRCYRLYLETPFWNELLHIPDVSVRPGPAPLDSAHEEVLRSRRMVIERLTHEQVDKWLLLNAFIARSKLHNLYLLFPRQYGPRAERYSSGSNPYGWDFRLRRGWLTHREGWYMVEGGFIRSVLEGPLRWLGLVIFDGDSDRLEHPSTFCLTRATSLILRNMPISAEDVPWGRLIVQPNFELVALAPVSEVLLLKLDRFAERLNLEHIAQYRLTRASVTRAIQIGLHAQRIQEELELAAGSEIPQNVRYSLVEWERQARRIEVWQGATLLEVDDIKLLDDLFADDATRSLFGRRLTPTLVEIAPQQLSAVQEVFWKRDYLPAMTMDGTTENGRIVGCEPQWRLHGDGLLQPSYGVTDLYLLAEVKRFSDRDESTGWYRITASSIRRAIADNITFSHIINFLQRYCEDGIPGSLLIRFKLWGSGYGLQDEIHIERAPLLRLSEQILRDLQNDEELAHLLGEEVETQSRLVRIDPTNLERVLELLRARGFNI